MAYQPLEGAGHPIPPDAPDFLTRQGLDALYHVVVTISRIWEQRPALPPPPGQSLVIANGKMSISLSDFCFYLGWASTILFDRSAKRSTENNSTFQIRMERTARVKDACDGIDLGVLSDRTVRNRMIHLDEHVAKMIARGAEPQFTNLGFVLHGDDDVPVDQCCRVYLFCQDKLLHLGAELDVRRVDAIARRVINRFPAYLAVGDVPPLDEPPLH